MKVIKIRNAAGVTYALEIDRTFVGIRQISKLLNPIPEVDNLRLASREEKRSEDLRLLFEYKGRSCVVWESFGDSSHFWIGAKNDESSFDAEEIALAFSKHEPSIVRRIMGSLLGVVITFRR